MILRDGSLQKRFWSLLRSQLSLPRFDLFLQGALLILTLYDGYASLLLRRSQVAGLLTPRVEDWVFIGAALAEFIFGVVLAWIGRKRRHFALAGWLLVTAVAGLLVLAFPQPDIKEFPVELCGGNSITQSLELTSLKPTPQFYASTTLVIITAVLCALTRISIWAHGITYLDDHENQNGAYFYGILISIRISVGVNSRTWFEGHAQSEDWWKGQLSFAALTLMFAVLFALFPRKMSSWKPLTEKEIEGDGFFETLSRLLRNKVLLTQTAALSFISAGVWGFIHYEREFVQTRFLLASASNWSDGRTSRLTGDILRTFVIVFFVAIFRARFSGRRPEGVKVTTAAKVGAVVSLMAAILFATLSSLRCDVGNVQGIREVEYHQLSCSSQCGCSSERHTFAPVCVLDSMTTYFSPCYAGCSTMEDLNGFYVFGNCTCGDSARAVRGACGAENCSIFFTVYQIVYINALALSAAAMLMQGMVVLRAVRRSDKPAALGLALGVVALIGHVLGHLLYMFISELNCAYAHGGSCLLHHTAFAPYLAGISAALLFGSAMLSLAAFLMARARERVAIG